MMSGQETSSVSPSAATKKRVRLLSPENSLNLYVVGQHLDDALSQWAQRQSATTAPHYRLLDIARLDLRLRANLDGLGVSYAKRLVD